MNVVITYQHRDPQYLELIDMAFASAKRLGYQTVLVGNEPQSVNMNIWFGAEREPRLMNWVLAAQLAYIESPLFDCDTVLFSPDALINKRLDSVFLQNFDVAFTVRSNPRWPINNGVIFMKPREKNRIALLWKDALDMCKSYPAETQDWYGDQQSLHDVYMQGNHLRHGITVKLLPCDEYNASPAMGGRLDDDLLQRAYVIHMKGKRKDMMKKYWNEICTRG